MLRLESIIIDAHGIRALAEFWRQALGWVTTYDEVDEICINPGGGDVNDPATWPFPEIAFEPVDDPDAGRQRVHLDMSPREDEDQAAYVDQLVALGARRVDVSQGPEVTWVVLAHPEGNEVASCRRATERDCQAARPSPARGLARMAGTGPQPIAVHPRFSREGARAPGSAGA